MTNVDRDGDDPAWNTGVSRSLWIDTGVAPVSYTHLDVYKRQTSSWESPLM